MPQVHAAILANTALAMVGILAKRLNDLGELDNETFKHLRAVLDHADAALPDGNPDALSILANLRLWLRDRPDGPGR
jgi:hypothetical protein